MPGILPMKVIKVGASTQARIAQACDRCRSKKIRCDGLTPTCSQCSSVGFECKTSDKLSRRAFPRGYTESLEDRVRSLENEVRELKDLLDEKDEKIDMLSKMHAQTPSSPRKSSFSPGTGVASETGIPCRPIREEVFKVQQPPCMISEEGSETFFVGSSSGRAFIDAFKSKLQESDKACREFDTSCFSARRPKPTKNNKTNPKEGRLWKALPRMTSDQLVNIYFQEWAPLFPILHRPTFLALYEQYVVDPNKITDMKLLAQLNLVFGIAALSNGAFNLEIVEQCERQWMRALKGFMLETSISNLQCLMLAQMFCIQRGEYASLVQYKGIAVSIAQRLGLHMSQRGFALGALTIETRKKLFWTLYALDCFSAAAIGLPKLLRDEDISCEYPVDADDEYITEEGFKANLPGEFTKLSSALALFRGSRILSKVLEQNYPAAVSQELSLRSIAELDEHLNEWSEELAPHLRMEFVQDKPSVQVVSSRCPILSMTYHYIRTLIHRPAVCANLGDRASSSVVALASSSKHIIQLLQLLDERNLSFSFCVNKNEMLTLSGFGILFQALDLDKNSKMVKDNGKSICSIIELLERRKAPGASEFKRIGCSMLSVVRNDTIQEIKSSPVDSVASIVTPVSEISTDTQKQLQLLTDRYAFAAAMADKSIRKTKEERRTSDPVLSSSKTQRHTLDSTITMISRPHSSSPHSCTLPDYPPKLPAHAASVYQPTPSADSATCATPNLDYFQIPTHSATRHQRQPKIEPPVHGTLWDSLLSSFDNCNHQPGDADHTTTYYNDDTTTIPLLTPDLHNYYPANLHRFSVSDVSSSWSSSADLWDFGGFDLGGSDQPPSQSVLSFSDESMTSGSVSGSGHDLGSIDFGGPAAGGCSKFSGHGGIVMPQQYTPESMDSPEDLPDLEVLQAIVGL